MSAPTEPGPSGRTDELILGDEVDEGQYLSLEAGVCSERTMTWTVTEPSGSGTPMNAIGSNQGHIGIDMQLKSAFINTETIEGGHKRGTLKDTICALPDTILVEGACAPIAVFIPMLIVVSILLTVFSVKNPMIIAGAGIVTMTLMGAIVTPGPIMIIGFVLSALGMSAVVIMIKR